MNDLIPSRRVRFAVFGLAAVAIASVAPVASATRVGGGTAPAASTVQGSVQEPVHVQTDESASLRQGTVGAVDERGARVKVQGVWIGLVAGKTQLLRGGRPAGLETLKAGEPIRFTVESASGGAPAMRVIYAP